MAAAFVDDVVSPELALVDPELAARARTTLPNAVAVERSFAIGFEFVPEELLPDDAVTRHRRHVAQLVVLASLAAASIVGAGVLRGDPSPNASETWSASGATSVVTSAGASSSATEAQSTQGAVVTEASVPVARVASSMDELQPQDLSSSGTAPIGTPSVSTGAAVASTVAARPTALVWDGLGNASSYDIELVRNGSRIFAASAQSPRVNVPRSWMHDGERFAVQPEDQVFVWPVVHGRRAGRPVVNGTHVFDNNLFARFTG